MDKKLISYVPTTRNMHAHTETRKTHTHIHIERDIYFIRLLYNRKRDEIWFFSHHRLYLRTLTRQIQSVDSLLQYERRKTENFERETIFAFRERSWRKTHPRVSDDFWEGGELRSRWLHNKRTATFAKVPKDRNSLRTLPARNVTIKYNTHRMIITIIQY